MTLMNTYEVTVYNICVLNKLDGIMAAFKYQREWYFCC